MRKLQKTLAILVASSNFLITGICHSEPPFVQSDDKACCRLYNRQILKGYFSELC